jgi:hypothetical protein
LCDEQERDLDGLLDLLHCPVRRSILLALASAGRDGAQGGQGGPANVKGLVAFAELERFRNIVAHNGALPSDDDFQHVELSFKQWCKQVGA